MHGHNYELLIAERLSAKSLILQCVFSVGGVWCPASGMQFVILRNAICHTSGMQLKVWLVRKHLSRLGMQLKDPVYKNLCTLM